MPSLEDLFNGAWRNAFRFEALPQYSITGSEEESVFKAYLNGELHPLPGNTDWISSIHKWTAEGKLLRRVRMIPNQFSPYVNCELEWAYLFNYLAGEQISVVGESVLRSVVPKIPPDFWIFDSRFVAVLKYGPKGEWLGVDILQNNIKEYLDLKKIIEQVSIDFKSHLRFKRSIDTRGETI